MGDAPRLTDEREIVAKAISDAVISIRPHSPRWEDLHPDVQATFHLMAQAAIDSRRAQSEGQAKVVEANKKIDEALCNYLNWTDDFGATDPEHPRVFKMLCDAYNAWHAALTPIGDSSGEAAHPGGRGE